MTLLQWLACFFGAHDWFEYKEKYKVGPHTDGAEWRFTKRVCRDCGEHQKLRPTIPRNARSTIETLPPKDVPTLNA